MANPTTNYGFVLPTPSDLVTDLPADFDIALQGVDTRLKALQPGTTLGDLAYSSATANTNTRLPIGTSGQVLAVSGAGVPAWTTTADVTPLTTKGDLFTFTTVDARLAVGANGETLVADSSTATGLRWQGDYAAGKNKIINGDFYVNQRGFSSTTTSGAFMFDRWTNYLNNGTVTLSSQSFTLGAAPVAGYEGKSFLQCVTTGQTTTDAAALVNQKIESVRTFANQTATISFWAKANSGTPKIAVEVSQGFGTGGSPSASVNTYVGQVTLSTSWARYTVTVNVPSIAGKTIGTDNNDFLNLAFWVSAGTDFNARTGSLGIQTNTFGIWGVQVEAGSVATAFQTATGTIQGELAACQRYYYRNTPATAYGWHSFGNGETTTTLIAPFQPPVSMRVLPTSVEYSNLQINEPGAGAITITAVAVSGSYGGANITALTVSAASGLVANKMYRIINNNNTAGYLAVSAEL